MNANGRAWVSTLTTGKCTTLHMCTAPLLLAPETCAVSFQQHRPVARLPRGPEHEAKCIEKEHGPAQHGRMRSSQMQSERRNLMQPGVASLHVQLYTGRACTSNVPDVACEDGPHDQEGELGEEAQHASEEEHPGQHGCHSPRSDAVHTCTRPQYDHRTNACP